MRYNPIWKRLICCFLALVMLLSYVPVPILNAATASGTCGTNVTWILENGTLTISGSGAMTNYKSSSMPWYNYRNEIESIIIEDGVTSVGNYAFYGCSNLADVQMGNSVTSIGTYAFQNCKGLTETGIGNGVETLGAYAFFGCTGLTSVVVPDNVMKVGIYAFNGCTNLKSVEFGNAVTEIQGSSFSGCAQLETVILNAENCTTVSVNAFTTNPNLTTVIIGQDVDSVSAQFWTALKSAKQLMFQGPNYFSVEAVPTGTSFGDRLDVLPAGNYYADENGVLYEIKNGEASLVYCPPGMETLTVPQELEQLGEEGPYSVTGVGSHSLMAADNLTEIIFERPETITKLDALAMAACPTLLSVNGKTLQEEAKASFPNAQIGVNVFYNTGLTDELDGERTDAVIELKPENGPQLSLETKSDIYYTGQTCQTTINVSNPDNASTDNVIRVYFQFSDDDGILSYPPGAYPLIVNGNEYTFYVCETESNAIYYVELPQPKEGDTISLHITTYYPSPTSDGGNVIVWGAVLTKEEAELLGNGITAPDTYQQSNWITRPDTFPVSKDKNGTAALVGDGEDNGNIYVSNLSYRISTKREGDTLQGVGKDYVRFVAYEDILTLPEGTAWREGLLDAIQNGQYRIEKRNSSNEIHYYVTVDGEEIELCYLNNSSTSMTRSAELALTEDGNNIILRWKDTNSYSSTEMALYNITLTYGNRVICVTDPAIAAGKTYQYFTNDVKVVQHFTYSEPASWEAQAEHSVTVGAANFSISKSAYDYKAYLGNTFKFYIELSNTGALPYEYLTKVTDPLQNIFYIKPEDMQTMFDTDAADDKAILSIRIANATLCAKVPTGTVTGTDGETYPVINATTGVGTQYSGLELTDSVDTETADLLLQWAEDEKMLQLTVEKNDGTTTTYTIGEGGAYPTIQAAFDAMGYLVTRSTAFTPTWTFVEGFKLWGGQKVRYDVLSTAKDSFMYAQQDMEHRVTSSNISYENYGYAYHTDTSQTTQYKRQRVSGSVGYDFDLQKSASVNGTTADENTTLTEGDVIGYTLSLEHRGNASYEALPLVDHMQGAQVLLVPVGGNEHLGLEPYNLKEETIGEGVYYVLDQVGEYKNVTVGGLLTESVTVTDAGTNGLDTLIRWYLADVTGTVTTTVNYETLIAPSRAGYEGVVYTMDNEVWAGDHQSHRLWAALFGLVGTRMSFDKSIVTDMGEPTVADDVLADFSVIKEGATVTYRFTLHNLGESSITVTGDNIYDILPASVNNFWDKEDITVRYVAADGTAFPVTNGDHWYVAQTGPAGESATNRQYLCWQNDFSMQIEDFIFIYVTLKCPAGETWSDYVQAYADTRLQNDLMVYQRQDSVFHDLAATAEAVLQKGVYRNSVQHVNHGSSTQWSTWEDSRLYYANSDAYDRVVLYYVTLYNGGKGRLYINDLQDLLPKGFTLDCVSTPNSLTNGFASGASTTSTTQWAEATDPVHSGISWRSAKVDFSTEMLSSGQQKITFSLSANTSGTVYDLRYDEVLGKYYLLAGEGVKFAYACVTNEAKDTEDSALNQVVMPYYDYTGAGVKVYDQVSIVGEDLGNIRENDGECEILDNGTVEGLGFAGGQADTQWLSSDVTMIRGKIVPGIVKSVQGNASYAGPLDTLQWTVKVTNTGEYPITDYTVTDVMQAPYQFTGAVNYNIYYATAGTTQLRLETLLFTVVSRTDTALIIKDGDGKEHTLPMDGTFVEITAKGSVRVQSGNYTVARKNQLFVSLQIDQHGNEVLSIHCQESGLSIPEGGRGELIVSTVNTTVYENKVYYNTAYITPNAQIYDADLVSLGNNAMLAGKPSVRNSYPITISIGYITSSEKIVEQVGDTSNSASGSDTTNYIILPDKETLFRFTLQVENTTENAMENLILIDNLPQPDDHSTFVETDLRYSDFKVSLAQNPEFTVVVILKDGTQTTLSSAQYKLEFSDNTEFSKGDWKGESADYWYSEPQGTTRSFRVVITDSTGTAIPADATVQVMFTAKVDGNPKPGQTAWNSFGYHYNLLGVVAELEAAPLKVGVRIPTVPELKKQLKLDDGTLFAAEKDETFRFLIYTGDAIQLSDGYTEELLAQSLEQAQRDVTYVELIVEKGKNTSETVALKDAVCYTFADGQWKATETAWNWVNGAKYTVMELPINHTDEFVYSTINGSSLVGYTFTYDYAKKESITCVNQRLSWKAVLHKTDADTGKPLAGAVFGLYSPDERDALSEDAYVTLQEKLGFAPRKTIAVDGATYYLVQVNTSNATGKITWTGLIRDAYYIWELRAPKGYFVSVDPQLITFADYETTPEITVPNRSYYELPSSAGEGIFWYTISGTLVLLVGVFLCVVGKRKSRV